jgi:membrane-bound lytic murein transglycosylase D
MPAQSLLKTVLLFMLWPLSSAVVAETNVAGDEIIILGDHSAITGLEASLGSGRSLLPDPVLGYLPDPVFEQPGEIAETDLADSDLWQRIKDGYAIPEIQSVYTANHESWYASRPDYVKRMVLRSQKYLYHIVEEVEKRGMPTEIALLPMVESAFNPQAYSRSHASGIWQFIPSTGKSFGLKQNWWVDNRRDVTAATNAALTYLQKLHVMFGTWDLALAAYNAGEGTVKRAIDRNRKRGLPTDYASLALPPETKNYVPKLQAIKNIMTHPEQYGLSIDPIPNRPYFTRVTAPQQIDAHLAAELAEVPFEEFSALNPEYNRPVLTATGNVHEILLPVSAAEIFTTNLANYDKPLVSWQTYHAKSGERVESIARKFGISIAQLRDINDLPSRKNLRQPRQLLVPVNNAESTSVALLVDNDDLQDIQEITEQAGKKEHKVKPGESLSVIAKRHKMTTKQIMALNKLKSSRLRAGQVLLVSADAALVRKPENVKQKHYIVKRGDTLNSIARRFEIATDELQRWNNIRGTHILPGHKLAVSRPDEA